MVRNSKGFSLLEIVAVLATIAVIGGSIMPLLGGVSSKMSDRQYRVEAKLETIRLALEEHWYQKRAFPSDLLSSGRLSAASAFVNTFLNSGIGYGNGTAADIYFDDYSPSGGNLRAATNGRGDIAYVWSVGPNGTDDTRTSDDIVIIALGEIPGRRHTRYLLDIIAHAFSKKIAAAGRPAMAAWSAAACTDATCQRVGLGLGHEFAGDGFNALFVTFRNTVFTAGLIRSKGPDGADNTGMGVDAVGAGDDMRE